MGTLGAMFCLARKVRCRTAASMAEMKWQTLSLELAHWEGGSHQSMQYSSNVAAGVGCCRSAASKYL